MRFFSTQIIIVKIEQNIKPEAESKKLLAPKPERNIKNRLPNMDMIQVDENKPKSSELRHRH